MIEKLNLVNKLGRKPRIANDKIQRSNPANEWDCVVTGSRGCRQTPWSWQGRDWCHWPLWGEAGQPGPLGRSARWPEPGEGWGRGTPGLQQLRGKWSWPSQCSGALFWGKGGSGGREVGVLERQVAGGGLAAAPGCMALSARGLWGGTVSDARRSLFHFLRPRHHLTSDWGTTGNWGGGSVLVQTGHVFFVSL